MHYPGTRTCEAESIQLLPVQDFLDAKAPHEAAVAWMPRVRRCSLDSGL